MIRITTIGLDKMIDSLNKAPKKIQSEVSQEIAVAAAEFEAGSVKNLISQGGDTGTLAKSIGKKQETPFAWDVFVGAYYAPFIEFGTKGKYKNPLGVEVPAYTKRGDFSQMLASLEKWVKRKGIGVTYKVSTRKKNRQTKNDIRQIAFAIAVSLLKNGVTPKPFFYSNITPVKANLTKRIEAVLNGL